MAEADRAYIVDSSHSGDPYNGGYQSDQNQPIPLGPSSGDYSNLQSSHNYHDDWNQQAPRGPSSRVRDFTNSCLSISGGDQFLI